MNKTLKKKIIFTVLNSKYIIKCECLNNLIHIDDKILYNLYYVSFYYKKVKVIKIYDNNKNIVLNSIHFPEYKYPLQKDLVIELKKFKKNIYFKIFLRAFMNKHKINNIKYHIRENGETYCFENNIIKFNCFINFLKLKNSAIFYDHDRIIYYLYDNYKYFSIIYYLYNGLFFYEINNIYNNEIKITRFIKERKKDTDIFKQIIICNQKLTILKLLEYDIKKNVYEENRDNNGKIINIKKYDNNTNELKTIFSNDNDKSISINSNENFSQNLLSFYNSNIKYDLNKLTYIINKKLHKSQMTLLNE